MEMVRKTMAESFFLMDYVNDEVVVKRVYDRIRYLKSKKYKGTIAAIEEINKDQATTSWVTDHHEGASQSTQRRREGWDEEDEEVLKTVFYRYEERPAKRDIKLLFHQDDRLKEIMERKGDFERCYNKVKNLFRSDNRTKKVTSSSRQGAVGDKKN